MDKSKISIILPVYNAHTIPKYLTKSIEKLNYPSKYLEIIIVEILKKTKKLTFKKFKTKKITVGKRVGYGEAANIGIKESSGKLILLLNTDVKLHEDMLKILADFFEINKVVGIVGPRVLSLDDPRDVSIYDIPGINFKRLLGRIKPIKPQFIAALDNPTVVDWLSGSIMFFKKTVWEKVKGFDTRYFMYWEDSDFCIRAKDLKYKSYLVPNAVAWHKGSAIIGKNNLEKTYYQSRNYLLFMYKNASFFGKCIFTFKSLAVFSYKLIKIIFKRNEINEKFLLGMIDFYLGRFGKRL